MAIAQTYEPIATTTLGSTASSYTFSSIPSTFTDLVLVVNGLMNSDAGIQIRVNGDGSGTTNYSRVYMVGAAVNGARSGRDTNDSWIGLSYWGASSGSRIIARLNFMNYSNTSINKTVIVREDSPKGLSNGNNDSITQVGMYRSTSAITSITVLSGTFGVGSTFTLYGIKAA